MDRKRWKVGQPAGFRLQHGYIGMSIDGVHYKAHRLAWLHFYGEWPAYEIDHINQNTSDNRICNLRVVSRAENEANKHKAQSNNKSSGIRGVTWDNQRNKWRVRLMKDGKMVHVSFHKDINAASDAYRKAKQDCT